MPDSVSNQPLDSWENEGGSFIFFAAGEIPPAPLDAAVQVRPDVEVSPRAHLLHALEHALKGAELRAGDLDAAIMNPENLTVHENDAWEQLCRWANEAEVRAEDTNYTAFHLDWLRDLHSKLV